MKSRDELQREACLTLAQHHRVIVAWGTGVGKSRVAVQTIDAMLNAGRNKILLLVGQTVHKSNWLHEFIDAKGEERGKEIYKSITVECYESLGKYEGQTFDYIVADEAHHLRSDNRTSFITTMQADYFLCLTATMSDNNDAEQLLLALESHFGKFVTLDFGIQDAIDNGILAVPKIYVHILPIDRLESMQTVNLSWGKPWLKNYRKEVSCDVKEFRNIYEHRAEQRYSNMSCNVECSTKDGYELLSEMIDNVGEDIKEKRDRIYTLQMQLNTPELNLVPLTLKQQSDCKKECRELLKEIEFQQTERKLLGAKRKVLLGKAKTLYAKWLLNKLGDNKYICFCANVEQCKELGGENIIHAQKKDNTKIVEAFNNNEIRSLFAVNMIKEGQNLKGIQAGVIVQLGGKERDFVQQFGRTMRSKCPVQHIIVINDTRDVTYFKNAIQGINPDYIKKIRYGER